MRRAAALPLAAALAWLACGASAPAETAAEEARPAVAVTGEGVATAAPDTAEVTAGVVTRASTAATALARNSEAMQRVLDVLAEAEITQEDVQTESLSVVPVRRQPSRDDPREEAEIVGYEVANRVRVVVRDLASLGSVLDTVVRAGANQIHGVSFSLAEPDEARDRARREAMVDARRAAALYAEAAGAALGPVLRVEEERQEFEPHFARMAMAEAGAVPTAPGTLTFTARVRVEYALEH